MQNGTMIQMFHWYAKTEDGFWNFVKDQASYLKSLGISSVWLPPACKAASGTCSVGYDIYDLYDLGEFDQKGSVATRWGTKEELKAAIQALHDHEIQVILDIVLNHKAGGDETEHFHAVKVNPDDRTEFISEPFEIEAYTRYTFPGRGSKYSDFIWNHTCFTGVDYAVGEEGNHIYTILNEHGDDWEEVIDTEKGNYDFLMYNDIEFRNRHVKEELYRWGIWLHQELGFDGVRLDAVKHMPTHFFNEWLNGLRDTLQKEIYAVGEYWAPGQLDLLERYISSTEGRMNLFDSALHHRFHEASNSGNDFDLRTIFDDTLVGTIPEKAVTLTDNHDTQPLQALEAPVEPWFKPLAYALILLREAGFPCVFFPDLYGATYEDNGADGGNYEIYLPKVPWIEEMLRARQQHAYGMQRDYLDHANCIGWTREGDDEHSGCAVLITNGDDGVKSMEIGERYAGKCFVDLLGTRPESIIIDEHGWGEFFVNAGSVSVWIEKI